MGIFDGEPPFVAKKVRKKKTSEKPKALKIEPPIEKRVVDNPEGLKTGDSLIHKIFGKGLVYRLLDNDKMICLFGKSKREIFADDIIPEQVPEKDSDE